MLSDEKKEKVIEVIGFWRDIIELSAFAMQRHGYGNSDGGFGIIYEGDLDEYDREVEGSFTPEAHVEVYGFWGKPDGYEFHIREQDYLLILSEVLEKQGLEREAKIVVNKMREIS